MQTRLGADGLTGRQLSIGSNRLQGSQPSCQSRVLGPRVPNHAAALPYLQATGSAVSHSIVARNASFSGKWLQPGGSKPRTAGIAKSTAVGAPSSLFSALAKGAAIRPIDYAFGYISA